MILVPSLIPENRSRILYMDGWFSGVTADDHLEGRSEERRANARPLLETALSIDPEQTTYQHAVIWHSSEDQLKRFTQQQDLHKWSRMLAQALLGMPKSLSEKRTVSHVATAEELSRIDALKRIDPTNGIPCYRKAFVLMRAGRFDEALAEVKAGNRAPSIREYYPLTLDGIEGSRVDPLIQNSAEDNPFINDQYIYSAVSQKLVERGRDLKGRGLKNDAAEVLRENCRMGMRVATASPQTAATFLSGSRIFEDGWDHLRTLGMSRDLLRLRTVMLGCSRYTANWLMSNPEIEATSRVPTFRWGMISTGVQWITASAYIALLAVIWQLLWFVASFSAPKKEELPSPWGRGWIAKSFTALYLPACTASAYLLYLTKLEGLTIIDESWNDLLPMLPFLLVQLGIIFLTIRRLQQARNLERERPMGWIKFLFGGPASHQAWIARHITIIQIANLIYLSCLLMAAVIVCKPILGVHPWQIQRLPVYSKIMNSERSMVEWTDLKVRKACPREWRLNL